MEGMSTGEIAAVVLVTGLVVVFMALVALIAVIKIYGTIVHNVQQKNRQKKLAAAAREAAPAPASVPAPAAAPAPVPQVEEGIPGEIVAAISAAVYSTLGEDASVVSVRRGKHTQGRSAWGQAGVWSNTRPF